MHEQPWVVFLLGGQAVIIACITTEKYAKKYAKNSIIYPQESTMRKQVNLKRYKKTWKR